MTADGGSQDNGGGDSDDEDASADSGEGADDLASMYDQSGTGAAGDSGSGRAAGGTDSTGGGADSAGESSSADGSADTAGGEDTDVSPGGLDAPVGQGTTEPETLTGTFYVKFATDSSVTLHEVDTGQIVTLIENPGFENHDIVEASLVAQPPMEVSYLVEDLEDRYTVPVETSPEPPTRQVQEIAAEMDEMEAAAIDREGEGEIHILRVAPDNIERTAEELHEDEMTYKNAARYGVSRVEIRTDESGIVSVRYLP